MLPHTHTNRHKHCKTSCQSDSEESQSFAETSLWFVINIFAIHNNLIDHFTGKTKSVTENLITLLLNVSGKILLTFKSFLFYPQTCIFQPSSLQTWLWFMAEINKKKKKLHAVRSANWIGTAHFDHLLPFLCPVCIRWSLKRQWEFHSWETETVYILYLLNTWFNPKLQHIQGRLCILSKGKNISLRTLILQL